MKAEELIKILEKNKDLSVKVMEIGKYEDDIPILSISKIEIEQNEDGEDEIILKVK